MKPPPRKEESRRIFESILGAALRSFESLGFKSTTTNKIAQLAGVSIGSLYRYFPNKEQILHRLIDTVSEESRQIFVRSLAAQAGRPLEEVVPRMAEVIVMRFVEKRGYYRVFFQYFHVLGQSEFIYQRRRQIANDTAAVLLKHFGEQIGEPDGLPERFYALTNACMGLVEEYCTSSSPTITVEQLKARVTEMIYVSLKVIKPSEQGS